MNMTLWSKKLKISYMKIIKFLYIIIDIIMSKFKQLSNKIQKQWHTKKEADAITASIGMKKYWKAGMARKAAAARK